MDEIAKPKYNRGRHALSRERKQMLLESAALAYVQMEHNDYKFAAGSQRGDRQPDGSYLVNHMEVMRRAGYSKGTLEKFHQLIEPNEEFWSLVELYRLRYTDPMFRKESENLLIETIGGELLRGIYEDVVYRIHDLSFDQKLKGAKFVLDAGISMMKLENKDTNKAERLLSTLDPDSRKKVVQARIRQIDKEKDELQRTMRAHEGADLQELRVPKTGVDLSGGEEDVNAD